MKIQKKHICRVLSRIDGKEQDMHGIEEDWENVIGLHDIATDKDLQSSLLGCAAEIVNFAHATRISSLHLTRQMGEQRKMLHLWHSVGVFWSYLSGDGCAHTPPTSLANFLAFIR